jgi:xylulokinase
VLGQPLSRTNVDDGAAFGAALLGGVAGGIWRDVAQAVAETVSVIETIEPDLGWSAQYRELRERFRRLYPALADATTSSAIAIAPRTPASSPSPGASR